MQLNETLYTFSVLQYRHDAWIGEALNVGVILAAPDIGFLRFKSRTTSSRLTKAYPGLDASVFRKMLQAIDTKVASIGKKIEQGSLFENIYTSDSVAQKLLPDDDSSLRWLAPGAGVTSSPHDELDRLFKRYVSRWDADASRVVRKDEDVYLVFQGKLRQSSVDVILEEKTIYTKRFGDVRFKHAFQNGQVHVVKPISLDMVDADKLFDKASRLVGTLTRLRDNTDVCPYVITGAPGNQRLTDEYAGALDLLRTAKVASKVVDEKDSHVVVDALVKAAESVH
ncbi:MAG: DUF3037 domain-containing protein [Planktomarina sp.]